MFFFFDICLDCGFVMYDEDDWMNGYGDKIGAYQRV